MKQTKQLKKPTLKQKEKAVHSPTGILSIFGTKEPRHFAIFMTTAFALLIAAGMFFHELWRDELEIYARIALAHKILVEGDFTLIFYHSFLRLCMMIWNSEVMFQAAHFLIIVSAVFIFLKFAKIPPLQKFLFIFSYFIVYDYGIISRYYGFLILLLFIIVILLTQKQPRYLLIVLLLLILANHTIQSTIFAASLSLYLILDTTRRFLQKKVTINATFILAGVLFIAGWCAILAAHYFITLKNTAYMGASEINPAPIFMNIKSVWNAFIPIPDPAPAASFWNTNIVNFPMIYYKGFNFQEVMTMPHYITFVISLIIILIISIKFSDKPMVLITFLLSTIVYLVFLQMLKVYYLRYQGLLFIIFAYCWFLYANAEDEEGLPFMNRIAQLFKNKAFAVLRRGFTPMLYIILLTQVYSAAYAFSKDMKYKFTLSQEAAGYISHNHLDKTHVMAGFFDYAAQTIAAHNKVKIYYPQVGHFNYYQEPYNTARKASMTVNDILLSCKKLRDSQDKDVLLILNFPMLVNDQELDRVARISTHVFITPIQSFTGTIIQEDEQFWLYEVFKK